MRSDSDDGSSDSSDPAGRRSSSHPTVSEQDEDEWPSEDDDGVVERRPAVTRGLQWRVARSAALVFLGIALAVGAALFLVRSSEPSAAAMSIELEGPHETVGTERDSTDDTDDTDTRDAPDNTEGAAADGAAVPSAVSTVPPPGGAGEGRDEVPHTLWVYVTGAVAVPGVVEVDADARLADVLEAAGGALPEADLERVNLAARPADLGSFAAALPGRRFSLEPLNLRQTGTSLLGGVMVGWGAIIGLGCTVGVFLSGTQAFAVSGWVFAASVVCGLALGYRTGVHRS